MPFSNESIPVESITLPNGATSGLRIVLDGSTDSIKMYNSNNVLVLQLDPTGLVAGNNLDLGAAANTIRVNVVNNITSNPSLQILPGQTFTGLWTPALFGTTLFNSGAANEYQALSIIAPGDPNHGAGPSAEIDITSGAADGSFNGQLTTFADHYQFQNHNGSLSLVDIDLNGNVSLKNGLLSAPFNGVGYGVVTAGIAASVTNIAPLEVAIPAATWAHEPNVTFKNGRLYRLILRYGTGLSGNANVTMQVKVRKGSASITGQILGVGNTQQSNSNAFLQAIPLIFYVANTSGADITTALSVTITQQVSQAVTARLYGDGGPGGAWGINLDLSVEDLGVASLNVLSNLAINIV